MDVQLEKILKCYLDDFNHKKNYDFVVKNSIPIVWFGDMDKYLSSNKKIVTVSLNPSDNEFPKRGKRRFNVEVSNIAQLYNTLCSYFKFNPYMGWFGKFENVLNCLDASYYSNCENVAIHIDIYSAIATNPTWGRLEEFQQEQIENTELFERLLEYLDPDVIVFSANQKVFEKTFGKYNLFYDKKIGNVGFIRVYSHNSTYLISGRNYNGTPFGGMKHDDIQETIKEISKSIL